MGQHNLWAARVELERPEADDTPACFNSRREYRMWKIAAANPANIKIHAGYCTDCTPAYQAEMLAAGRCEHPETEFIEDPEEPGAVMGIWQTPIE